MSNNGFPNTSLVQALAVSGTNIFAGIYGNSVYLSTNNGTSWTALNNGSNPSTVKAFAVSGTNIFAGSYGGGVHLSTNNGTNWTSVNHNLTDLNINASCCQRK